MDPVRRPQLPALSYLDVDKIKREEEAYQNRNAGTPQSLSTSAAASPTHHYPPGPPPPYSHATSAPSLVQSATAWQPASTYASVHTPPESRRTSEHEKESAKHGIRQSLPSISEALGVESQTSYATSTAPPSTLLPAHFPQPQAAAAAATSSPSPTPRRSYPMEPPPSSFPGAINYPQYAQHRSEQASQPSYPPPAEVTRQPPGSYPPQMERRPSYQASQPPPRPSQSTPFPRPQETSPTYEHPPAHPTGAMGPPSNFPYGYQSYPANYSKSTPATSASTGPIYQPSTVYSAEPRRLSTGWKSENTSPHDERSAGQANYGENVKRHLDFYDFELSLNEIASTCSILGDFSRRYGDRMHQTQRSGPSLSTLPGIVEIDDMISKSRAQLDSLLKIRDVVLTQQAAYEQQVADQRQQRKAYDEVSGPQPELQQPEPAEDSKTAGFAGVDTKKRRGRAAPPGRCHSCNRAETPEWRRGPDGARTLCNACGLHYAKLTRKNNGANKTTTISSSNLRPKES